MTDTEDPAAAAVRLEQALERIARLASRPQTETFDPDNARIGARLDALIAQLRAALSAATDA